MKDTPLNRTKKMIIKASIGLLVLGLFIVGLFLLFRHLGWTSYSKEEIRDIIAGFGGWGPFVFIGASFLQVTFIPIPGIIIILAGNLLFGPVLGILYSTIGMILGAIVAFALGRWLGRPFVDWVVGDKQEVENYLERLKGKENVLFFFMFLLPFFPDDALCSVAGITKMTWPVFIVMAVITRTISNIAAVIFMSGEVIPYEGWGFAVMFIVGVLSIIAFIYAYRFSDKINQVLDDFSAKFIKNRK